MAFTRKHYLEVGGILRDRKAKKSEIDRYVQMFKKDNPRFDAKRFRDYVAGKIKR